MQDAPINKAALLPWLFLILAILLCPRSVQAAEHSLQALFARPCRLFSIPPVLALAIASVESDLNPRCVTINGKEYRPKTDREAVLLAQRAIAQGASVDLGLMQVNSWWLKELKLSPAAVLAPKNNVFLGLWILHQEMKRCGAGWKAVGAYHSKKEARQRVYIAKVAERCRRLRSVLPAASRKMPHSKKPGENLYACRTIHP